MQRNRGLSLIDLLVAVIVIAVLALVTLPSFRGYSLRENRTAAKKILGEIATRQQAWFGNHQTYSASLIRLGYPADTLYLSRNGKLSLGTTDTSAYRISVAAIGNDDFTHCSVNTNPNASKRYAYVIIAEPQNLQATDDIACGTLCLYSNGQRGARTAASVDDVARSCWAR